MMRLTSALAVLALLAVTSCPAEDPGTGQQDVLTDNVVINMWGGDLAKMFARFGTPIDVVAARGSTREEDDVIFNYRTFLFRVRDQKVRTCFFWTTWKGPIRGIRIGDSREAVAKVLGKPRRVIKDKNGVETDYGYDLNTPKALMWTNFDTEGKVKRVEISAP